jgi:hypothetical protein
MTAESPKPKGGSKLARSEITTVRLDPKLRYLAELASRKQRRTLSSYIEWAVERSLGQVELADEVTVEDASVWLWDVDESERFIKLAIHRSDLLTHEEQERWKLLHDSGLLGPAKKRNPRGGVEWDQPVLEEVICPVVRRNWQGLKEAHDGGPAAAAAWLSTIRQEITMGLVYSDEEIAKWRTAPPGFDDSIPF